MQNKEFLKHSINFINSTIYSTSKLIEFYIEFGSKDEYLKDSIVKLLDGFEILVSNLPSVISGNLNGKSIKRSIIEALHKVQIEMYSFEEDSHAISLTWDEFNNKWLNFYKIINDLINQDRFIYINLN